MQTVNGKERWTPTNVHHHASKTNDKLYENWFSFIKKRNTVTIVVFPQYWHLVKVQVPALIDSDWRNIKQSLNNLAFR